MLVRLLPILAKVGPLHPAWLKRAAGVSLFIVALIVVDRTCPPNPDRYRTTSLRVLASDGTPLREYVTPDGMLRFDAQSADVDQKYIKLLMNTEDWRFWWHPGVDPMALARATWQLATRGHVVSGGSTLTMQVARLLAPHRHDVKGKFLDILRAFQLEERFSKRQILSMYLTLAPMGGNLEGVEAASEYYFGHSAEYLSPEEASLLVAIPQSPTRLRPDRHWLASQEAAHKIEKRAAITMAAVPLDAIHRRPAPLLAPHLADTIHKVQTSGAVVTTIDASLQRAVEGVATREASWLGDRATIAALIVRNTDRAVLAYLGNNNYWAAEGMVDMTRSRRSPGSTLKPFIYGLAFDEAIAAPNTLISDDPYRSGSYAPVDFDRNFRGTVTVTEALQQSLNSPAVQVLNALGPGHFAATLQISGINLTFPHGRWDPSLPLALGGVGISLRDLATLYSGLARDGMVMPLRFTTNAKTEKPISVMSKQASREILKILQEAPLPDGVAPPHRAIAYKTGTSYGFRDALSIGVSPGYTIAVWVGRPEGTPRPGSYGRNTAAPILFKLFDLLPPEPECSDWTTSNPNMANRRQQAPFLTRFDVTSERNAGVAAPPRILYPPSGAQIELGQVDGILAPLSLEAEGGVRPYRWIVNGHPLPAPEIGKSAAWTPDGPGYARISVIDANEHAASATIRIE